MLKSWLQKKISGINKKEFSKEEEVSEKEKATQRAQEYHNECKQKVRECEEEMFNKKCVFVSGTNRNCFKDCVHFESGCFDEVNVSLSTFKKPHIWVVDMSKPKLPRCKLWK